MFGNSYKPAWLYESLPYLYVVSGIVTILAVGNSIAVLSGSMLLSAGGVIWHMRRTYRRGRESEAARAPEKALVPLVWRAAFETAHPTIDAQHRDLFTRGNELVALVVEGHSQGDIELKLYELFWELEAHCDMEERIMAREGTPLSPEHLRLHRDLLERAKRLRGAYHDNEIGLAEVIRFVAYDVLIRHVVHDDAELRPAVAPAARRRVLRRP